MDDTLLQRIGRLALDQQQIQCCQGETAQEPLMSHHDNHLPEATECDNEASDINESDKIKFNEYIRKGRQYERTANYPKALEKYRKAYNIVQVEEVKKKLEKLQTFIDNQDPSGFYHLPSKKVFVLPGGLRVEERIFQKLYPHQREGLQWMFSLYSKEYFGGILADDMGLGKTIQVTTYVKSLIESELIDNALLFMPKGLITNWQNEFSKWAPNIRLKIFNGPNKQCLAGLKSVQKKGGVILTTFGLARTCTRHFNIDQQYTWDYVICDEGHLIKNHNSQAAKCLRQIPAVRRLILSGTPVQNDLLEIWSLYDYLCAGQLLGSYKDFKKEFVDPIKQASQKDASDEDKDLGDKLAMTLRDMYSPYFLRRDKRVWHEADGNITTSLNNGVPRLGKKIELVAWTYLRPAQQDLYRAFLKTPEVNKALNDKRSSLAALTVLKKICDHPALLSNNLETCQHLDIPFSSIEMPSEELLAHSGKLSFLVELLKNCMEHRFLIFCQTRKMLDIIEFVLKEKLSGSKYLRLDGTIHDRDERQRLIDEFNSDQSIFCFLLTTQVGGIGITLTSADRVILFDPSWNPARDEQAIDRAHRFGQTKDVIVYRLITCGTLEEKTYRIQVFKSYLRRMATENDKVSIKRYFTKHHLSEMFTLDDPFSCESHTLFSGLTENLGELSDAVKSELISLKNYDDIYGFTYHHLLYTEDGEKLIKATARATGERKIEELAKGAKTRLLTPSRSSNAANLTNQAPLSKRLFKQSNDGTRGSPISLEESKQIIDLEMENDTNLIAEPLNVVIDIEDETSNLDIIEIEPNNDMEVGQICGDLVDLDYEPNNGAMKEGDSCREIANVDYGSKPKESIFTIDTSCLSQTELDLFRGKMLEIASILDLI